MLLCKVKTNSGVPYECFVKRFDSLVWSIISYDASIWGTRSFPAIEAVFNRACRFYVGLGQQAPTVAVRGDMGMVPPLARQYREVARQYKRLNPLSHHDALKHHLTSLKTDLIFIQLGVLE